ncbi:MAG: SUMF1/EgtB/PvdO family nonheme iron enzyme, partial [Planctomycetota bacterium]|nr:SUMF1/EgtB/PvdO family nonheme iron enzyme [Planctomycetota bacterium]
MPKLPKQPWARCVALKSRPQDNERGGIWLWIMVLVIAAGAVGGGVYYREQTLVQEGEKALTEAEGHYQAKAYDKAEESYQLALEKWTAVGPWTPLNKEALVAERKSLMGLLRSRIRNVSDKDPLLAERLLGQLRTLDEKAGEETLEELIRERFSVSLLLSLEQKGYKKLDQVRKQLQSASGPISPALKQLSADGAKRGKARDYVSGLIRLLVQQQWKKVDRHIIEKAVLKESEGVFKGFKKEYQELVAKEKRAKEIFASWNKLNECDSMIQGWTLKLRKDARFLGDLHNNPDHDKYDFPTMPDGDTAGFETLISEFNKKRDSLKALHGRFRDLANDYADMSLIEASPTKDHIKLIFMDRFEVTRERFKKQFLDKGGYTKKLKDNWSEKGWESIVVTREMTQPENWNTDESMLRPVSHVSFWEAQAYAKTVNKQLPTKANWLAALAGEKYPWGSEWVEDATNLAVKGKKLELREVGSFSGGRNSGGISDLFGNVREWAYEDGDNPSEPRAWLMGGSFETEESFVKQLDKTVLYERDA